jgi:hypothetical protein
MTNAILIKVALSILAALLVVAGAIAEAEYSHAKLNRPATKQEQKRAAVPVTHWANAVKNY